MKYSGNLTPERIKELLSYDPDTGVFVWLKSRGRAVKGNVAGYINKTGYISIRIDKKLIFAHRVAWVIATGDMPRGEIDHINGDRADNRIANLRDVDKFINMQNMRKAPSTNKSTGAIGVQPCGNKFRASIRINGKKTYIGLFNTVEEASAAYIECKRKHHAGCTV